MLSLVIFILIFVFILFLRRFDFDVILKFDYVYNQNAFVKTHHSKTSWLLLSFFVFSILFSLGNII
ncbi:hypothetical protein A0G02_03950 [Pectobacterium peruviense]|uniref:Uncharacterized protein n=1 Tax=Pectobacterium peruviense TaxID=2066479 RepID=A0ABX4S2C3_9GAMM|nr:hypothetical protein G033_18380 [Pectobacterium peruviense]PKX81560.1 hypothetical protein A0G02_03950 [Pectobacterium peruviense]PKX84657.1 hypothetical protein A0G03_19765 [Pectobacterium peruviense]